MEFMAIAYPAPITMFWPDEITDQDRAWADNVIRRVVRRAYKWNPRPHSPGESLRIFGWDNPLSPDGVHIAQPGRVSPYERERLSTDERIAALKSRLSALSQRVRVPPETWEEWGTYQDWRRCRRALWRCWGFVA
jgi:hypothetical protein